MFSFSLSIRYKLGALAPVEDPGEGCCLGLAAHASRGDRVSRNKISFYIFSDCCNSYFNLLIIKYVKASYVGYLPNCFYKIRMKIDLVTN